MATGSFVGVNPGTVLFLATGPTYSEGGQTVQDSKVIIGESYLAHYTVDNNGATAPPTSTPKAWFTLNAGASLVIRVRRLLISQDTVATTTAGSLLLGLYRTTSAPVGGTVQTPRPFDPGDAAAGATAASVDNSVFTSDPTSVGRLALFSLPVAVAYPTPPPFELRFGDQPGTKSLVIPAGTSNGLALLLISANAFGGTPKFTISFEFTEAPF